MTTDTDDLKSRKLCLDCVGEVFLSTEISKQGTHGLCFYCNESGKVYSIEQMSERIETAFEQHFIRTSDQPEHFHYIDWEREGEPVVCAIMNAAEIPEPAASDIHSLLGQKNYNYDADAFGEETEFSSDSYYGDKAADDAQWQGEWSEFERSLKTEARFFSRSASRLLASIFDGIEKMETRDGRSLIVDAGPGTVLSSVFRARTFQSNETLEISLARPDNHLGSPPAAHASAGRMNARGISVFYGANDPMVALAEVRPPVGSQVAVARFEIIRPIRLLDLTALNEVATYGSLFDSTLLARLERTRFLRALSRRITVPVMPDDETFEYLVTQAIADFLSTENNPPLDGIIFPSVQATGEALNLVLFHKAARVEEIELPPGTEISSSLAQRYADGWEREYSVLEEVSPKKEEPEQQGPSGFPHLTEFDFSIGNQDYNDHPPTLRVDLESVRVHVVEAVQFKTKEHTVRRYRHEKIEPEF